MALQTVNYTNPSSGSKVVFYNDESGNSNLTQATYLCDPTVPGTPIDFLGQMKQTNELLLLILQTLTTLTEKQSLTGG